MSMRRGQSESRSSHLSGLLALELQPTHIEGHLYSENQADSVMPSFHHNETLKFENDSNS